MKDIGFPGARAAGEFASGFARESFLIQKETDVAELRV